MTGGLRSRAARAGALAAALAAAAIAPGCSSIRGTGTEPAPVARPAEEPIQLDRELSEARIARKEARLADAALHYERAIRVAPRIFSARIELVETLLERSVELGRAERLLDEAQTLNPDDAVVDRLRGQLDEVRGDLARAVEDYGRALAKAPDPDLRLRRADLLLRLDRADDAIAELEAACAERPQDRSLRMTLAERYESRGRVVDAERILVGLTEEVPRQAGLLHHLAAFYRRTGQPTKAVEAEGRARALETPPPRRNLRPLLPSKR